MYLLLADVANDVDVGLVELALGRILGRIKTYITVDGDVYIPASYGRHG